MIDRIDEKKEGMDFSNKLKAYDIKTIEKCIAEAISQLTGENYDCDINDISYKFLPETMQFRVRISNNYKIGSE